MAGPFTGSGPPASVLSSTSATISSVSARKAAGSASGAGSFGNARRYQDSIRLPGTLNFDMLAEKRIPLPESYSLTFRFEAFNVVNRVQLTGLNTSESSSSFGTLSPSQANSPRSLQASLRFAF
jgi:hypothetical protein